MSEEKKKKKRAYRMTDLQMLKLIRLYSERPSLWDQMDPKYKDRKLRSRTLSEIAALMDLPGFGSREAAIKIKNLRTTFKQEERKVKESQLAGGEYLPKLHWYHFVDNFLNKRQKKGRGKANAGSSTSVQKEVEVVDLDGLFETSREIKSESYLWLNDGEQLHESSGMSSTIGGVRWKGISDDVDEDYDGSPPPSPTSRASSPVQLDDPLKIPDDPLTMEEDPLAIKNVLLTIKEDSLTAKNRSPPPLKPKNSSLVQLETSRIERNSPVIHDGLPTIQLGPSALKEPDEFDYFSKSLAVQLRSMPLVSALGCMERLQALVSEERLRLLTANNH